MRESKKAAHAQSRYRQVRKDLGWSRAELAAKMGVDATTVGNWKTGTRRMTLEKLMLFSEITGFSVEYLLGIDGEQINWLKPISKTALKAMHRSPVWSVSHGWGLINAAKHMLVFADLQTMPLEAIEEPLYAFPPVLSYALYAMGEPLRRSEVETRTTIWLEVITTDLELSIACRGWYHLYEKRMVFNEFGHRFYLDTYGVKWLAFDDCFPSPAEKGLE